MAEEPGNRLVSSMTDSQEFIEPDTHSFVVKIWFEKAGTDSHSLLWRGYITHVASGKRQYLTQLHSITDFVENYLPSVSRRTSFIRQLRRFFSKTE